MNNNLCPFGLFYRQKHKSCSISIWNVCMILQCQPRSLQRIESGQSEPSVSQAIRMINALNISVGEFFFDLAVQSYTQEEIYQYIDKNISEYKGLEYDKTEITDFGTAFKYIRTLNNLSQKKIADRTGYYIRNITSMENRGQSPRVMRALNMVRATGYDIRAFFEWLNEIVQNNKTHENI